MNQAIIDRFTSLEDRRKTLVDRVKQMTPAMQNSRSNPKAFTPAEVIEHFALIEDFNVGFLDKNPPETLKGVKTAIRFIGKKTMSDMSNPNNFMAQTLPSAIPKGSVDVEAAAKKWESVRARMGKHLSAVTNPDDAFIKMMWLFGTLSANDYLKLTEMHMTYHETQLPG